MPDSGWWSALWPAPGRVLAVLGIEPGLDVVDLCCGDGHFTAAIVQRVAAIDIDPRMLELARTRVAAAGAGHCTFIEGDAYDSAALVPWPADLVFMPNTFHGVPDKERLARAVAAILKPTAGSSSLTGIAAARGDAGSRQATRPEDRYSHGADGRRRGA